jgi:hypothetical protein
MIEHAESASDRAAVHRMESRGLRMMYSLMISA